jgi:hypothetical protein
MRAISFALIAAGGYTDAPNPVFDNSASNHLSMRDPRVCGNAHQKGLDTISTKSHAKSRCEANSLCSFDSLKAMGSQSI